MRRAPSSQSSVRYRILVPGVLRGKRASGMATTTASGSQPVRDRAEVMARSSNSAVSLRTPGRVTPGGTVTRSRKIESDTRSSPAGPSAPRGAGRPHKRAAVFSIARVGGSTHRTGRDLASDSTIRLSVPATPSQFVPAIQTIGPWLLMPRPRPLAGATALLCPELPAAGPPHTAAAIR